jgi:hypothetical protein
MKTTLRVGAILLAAVTGPAWGQMLDLSGLDKLEARAKEVNNVTLDENLIKLAGGFLNGKDKDQQAVKTLVDGLKGVYVRNFEFASKDQYSMADVEPIRQQIRARGWSRIVESKQKNDDGTVSEIDEVYLNTGAGGGLAVICAEPKELSVVYIDGVLKVQDLQKLHALGVPNINIEGDGKDHSDKDKK